MASDRRPPTVDDRTRSDILGEIERVAPYYTDRWTPQPGTGEPGWGVAELFSEMVADVLTRLNRVPEKHRVGFYEAIGFEREPPQSSRLPLAVTLDEETSGNVLISPGLRAAAPAAEDRPEQLFELPPDEGFEATPARLRRLYSVDPTVDGIFEHHSALEADRPTQLFGGDSRQRHALHIGHAGLFDLPGGSSIQLRLWASNPAVLGHVQWEFYEERNDGDDGEGEGEGDPDAHWHAFADGEVEDDDVGSGARPSTVTLTLPSPLSESEPGFEELTETTIGGVESRWIRCRVRPGVSPETFEALGLDGVAICLGTGSARPDALLSGGVPVAVPQAPPDGSPPGDESDSERVTPFGETPAPGDEFYVACREAFTKRDTTVTVTLSDVTIEGGLPETVVGTLDPPDVAWQYWNGKTWALLPDVTSKVDPPSVGLTGDDVLNLRADGTISFTVPTDLAPTTVAGVEGHWIRAQLQEGRHTQVTYQKKTNVPETLPADPPVPDAELWTIITEGVGIPQFGDLSIEYGGAALTDGGDDPEGETGWQPPEALVSLNNLAYRPEPVDTPGVRPFRRLPDESQTVYLGFDAPLVDGPIHLFVSPVDREYPETFHPRLRWEYGAAAGGDEWTRARVRDGTADLTRRGLVRLVFERETVAHGRFGTDLHWVRARVTDPEGLFDRTADGTNGANDGGGGGSSPTPGEGGMALRSGTCSYGGSTAGCLESCDGVRRLRTVPPAGRPSTAPPTLRRVVPNTGWLRNVRTVTEETLGGSDGSPDQRFVVDSPPALTTTLWVDERATLSAAERAALTESSPERIETITTPDGETEAVWIRWTEVPDFLHSTAEDRHYKLDHLAGELGFGDDVSGTIPPRGTENVRATYETGGGAGGNVAAGAVTELTSNLRPVEAVTNPEAGDGGADAESLAGVLARAPAELRDRDRAVARMDFERIALAASRKLARARCLPRRDDAGERRLGWVTVIVVPRTDDRRPTLSAELRRQVRAALAERCPATLVAPIRRLVVRGPSYVEAAVTADVVTAADTESVSTVETAVTDAITAFLHPLSGGPADAGWPFGELPCVSDVYALLEGVDGVDHVEAVTVTYRGVGTDDTVVVDDDAATPTVGPDALVSSGNHAVSVVPGSRTPTAGGP